MPTLSDAYYNIQKILKPQKQGTCGLYSFWFATLMLNSIRTGRKQVVYPRGCEGGAVDGVSLRKFTKDTLGSAQGELLNHDEIAAMIHGFGWDFEVNDGGGEQRKTFITNSLRQTRPVMFSYLAGGASYGGEQAVMPLRSVPANRACGPHWSLIVDESNMAYGFVEPNHPNGMKWDSKQTILRSNEIVDDFVMDRWWVKPASSPKGQATVQPYAQGVQFKKVYDVKVAGRQALNNLLFAVF